MLTRLQLPINCPDSKEIKLVLIDTNGNKTYYALNNKHIGRELEAFQNKKGAVQTTIEQRQNNEKINR